MKIKILIASILTIVGIAFVTNFFNAEKAVASQIEKNVSAPDMDEWSDASKKAADIMKEKYGEPDEKTASMMIWYNSGPWKRTIVYAKETKHNFPMPHTDVMEQSIDYKVPVEKFTDLAKYDGSVVCSRTNGEISAYCDKEEANILAINLANDIIRGAKDVKSARDFYANSVNEFMKGGKPEYMQKLQFAVAKGGTADADEMSPLIDKDEMNKMEKEKAGASRK